MNSPPGHVPPDVDPRKFQCPSGSQIVLAKIRPAVSGAPVLIAVGEEV